jgi:hypothetical protein
MNLFDLPLKVVNIGLESFYESLQDQDVICAHVVWKPIAGGDLRLAAILDVLNQ